MQAWEAYCTPGPGQAEMSQWVGTWLTKSEFWMKPGGPPEVSEGVTVRYMDMDGRFLVEDHTSVFMGMPFRGRGTIGWDNGLNSFVTTWYDNMGTGISYGHGNWNSDHSQIDWSYTQTDPMTSRTSSMRGTWNWSKTGDLVFNAWMPGPDGKEFHGMRITYSRPVGPNMANAEFGSGN